MTIRSPLFSKLRNSQLSKTIILLLFFYIVLYSISYILFKDIYLPSQSRAGDFVFKNFLIYNFGLKAFLYPFKFLLITLLILLGAFIVNIESPNFITTYRLTIIAEFVQLIPNLLIINWFSIYPESLSSSSHKQAFTSLSPHINMVENKTSALYILLETISTFEVLYILFLSYLIMEANEIGFFKAFVMSGLMYFLASLLWNLVTLLIIF